MEEVFVCFFFCFFVGTSVLISPVAAGALKEVFIKSVIKTVW